MQNNSVLRFMKNLILPLVLVAGSANVAMAQVLDYSVTKYLCPVSSHIPASDILADCAEVPSPGYTPVYANTPVTFGLEIDFNTTAPNGMQVIQDYLPTGFNFVSMFCSKDGGPNVQVTSFTVVPGAPDILNALVNSNGAQTATCAINGFFSGDPNTFGKENNIGVFDPNDVPPYIGVWDPAISDTLGFDTAIPTQFPVDVSISKSASETSIDVSGGPVEVEYTIVIRNESSGATGETLFLGQGFGVHDQQALSTNSVAFHASLTEFSCATTNASMDCVELPGGTVLPTSPPIVVGSVNPVDLFMAQFPAGQNGELGPQDEITLTYKVEYSKFLECTRFDTDGVENLVFFNQTYVDGNGGTVGTIFEADPTNNTADASVAIHTGETFLNPDCPIPEPSLAPPPIISVAKTIGGTGGLIDWTTGVVYFKIILENISGSNNIPAQTVTNIRLRDTLLQIAGTPGFRAETVANSWTCAVEDSTGGTANPASQCGTESSNSPQDFNYYGAHHQIWELDPQTVDLAAGDKAVIKFQMTFDDLTCDSLDALLPNLDPLLPNKIRNRAWAAYGPVNVQFTDNTFHDVTYAMHDDAVVEMNAADECNFQVVKKTQDTKIVFDTDIEYRVLFSNNDTQSRIVGTTYDAIRIFQSGYATSMVFDYKYNCWLNDVTKPVTPVGSMPNFPQFPIPPAIFASGTITHNTLPSQGARIIDFGPLEYAAGAELVCDITINVKQPTDKSLCKGDEFAHLENIALMDVSSTYNNNLPFPPSGPSGIYNQTTPTVGTAVPDPSNQANWDSWSSLSLPLPKCYDIAVGKTMDRGFTWEGGPSPVFGVSVSNPGDGLEGSPNGNDWDGIVLSDAISQSGTPPSTLNFGFAPGPTNVLNDLCTNGNIGCVWVQNGVLPLPFLPFDLGLADFDTGEEAIATYQVNGGFVRGDRICNTASAVMSGPTADQDWFTHPDFIGPTDSETKCFDVLNHGKLVITKTVLNHTLGEIPAIDFQIDVACSEATAPTFDATHPVDSRHVSVAGVQSGHSASGITALDFPVHSGGGNCTVSEAGLLSPFDLDQANAEFAFCDKTQLAVWKTPVYVPANAGSGGINVPVPPSGAAEVEVINELTCVPRTSTLTVTKKFKDGHIPGSGDFWVSVSCNAPGGMPNPLILNFANGYEAEHTGIPVGATCDIAEILPSPNQPNPPNGCKWVADYPMGQSTTLDLEDANLIIVNRLSCTKPIPGELIVRKTFLNNSDEPIAAAEFKFDAQCSQPPHAGTFGVVTGLVPVGSSTGSAAQVAIPLNGTTGTNDCVVTEFAPEQINGPLDPDLCHGGDPVWQAPTYSFNGSVIAAGTPITIQNGSANILSVVNEVICKKPTVPLRSLKVIKQVVRGNLPPSISLAGAQFDVNVKCAPDQGSIGNPTIDEDLVFAANPSTNPNWANNEELFVHNIPQGGFCEISEDTSTLPAFPAGSGCVWQVSYHTFNHLGMNPPAYRLGHPNSNDNELSIKNTAVCKTIAKKTALIITKKPDISAINPPISMSGAEFTVNVNCGPFSNHNVDLNGANGFTEILTGLDVGAHCTITETVQTVPGFPDNCKWAVSYDPQGQDITLQPTGNQAVVYNRAICSEIKPTEKAKLRITKEVINPKPNKPIDPSNLIFEVDLTCGLQNVPSTQTVEFKLPFDLQTTVTGLNVDDLCVVSERPLNGQGIEKHCQWTTTYQGPPTFWLQPGLNEIRVINTVDCGDTTTGGGQPKAPANLSITKTGPASCEAGTDCDFDIEIRNDSSADYIGPITVRDLASPSGLTIGSGQFAPWTCAPGAGATAFCAHPLVAIGAGSSISLQLPLKIPRSFNNGQSVKNCVKLASLVDIDLRTDMHTTQFLLNALGYDVGKVDGIAGSRTFAGATQFRKDSGIAKPTPILDALRMELVRNPATGEQFSRKSCTKVRVTKTLTCKFGQKPVNGQCREICPERGSNWDGRSCVSCKAGTNWNGKTRTCIKPAAKPVECAFPKVLSPRTGQCIDVIKDCPFGSIHNVLTGQCVSIIAQCPPGTKKVPGLDGCHK